MRKDYSILYKIAPLWILLFALVSCDSILPGDYQEESFQISDMDRQAVEILSQDLYIVDSSGAIVDSNFTPATALKIDEVIDTTGIGDNQQKQLEALLAQIDDLNTISAGQMVNVSFSSAEDGDYYYASADAQEAGRTFYISWQMTLSNYKIHIEIDMIGQNGTAVAKTAIMPPELIAAGLTTLAEGTKDEIRVAKIRTRASFSAGSGKQLLQFYISDPNAIGHFQIVIL